MRHSSLWKQLFFVSLADTWQTGHSDPAAVAAQVLYWQLSSKAPTADLVFLNTIFKIVTLGAPAVPQLHIMHSYAGSDRPSIRIYRQHECALGWICQY